MVRKNDYVSVGDKPAICFTWRYIYKPRNMKCRDRSENVRRCFEYRCYLYFSLAITDHRPLTYSGLKTQICVSKIDHHRFK